MIPPLHTELPLLGTFTFLLLVALFWWPALRLHLFLRAPEQSRETAAALAFVTAFGVFSLVTAPFLLTHAPTEAALYAVGIVWLCWTVGTEILLRRRPPPGRTPSAIPAPAFEGASPFPSLAFGTLLFTAVAALLCAQEILPRRYGLLAILFSAACNATVVFSFWRRDRNTKVQGSRQATDGTASADWNLPLTRAAGLLLLIGMVVSSFFYLRADADDNLYLSEALMLLGSDAMALHAPTHRGEALPANPMYGWQSFELWSAMLARLSGLHPLVVMRTLCAPLLLLLSIGLYRGLLRRVLPADLLPYATVLLLGYFLFGMSSQWTPNNYLLPRPQQGKTWLMHLGVAAMVLQSLQFLEFPHAKTWVPALLVSFACLGWAPTAILLVPMLLATLGLTHLLASLDIRSIKPVLLLGLCALPPLLFGLHLHGQQEALNLEASLDWEEDSPWTGLFFYQFLQGHSLGGGLELFLLCASPLLLLGIRSLRQASYPTLYLVAMGLFTINPLLFGLVQDFTGDTAYLRFFWLLPLPILLALLGTRVIQTLRARGIPEVLGLALFLGFYPMFGGHYVWSEANLYDPPEEGIYLTEATNPMKVPDGLLAIAQELRGLPLGPERRILCHLNEVMHLAPLVPDFDFVYARNFQTLAPLLQLGRAEEAARRERLGTSFLKGEMDAREAAPLLEQELATYIVLGPWTGDLKGLLVELGYRERSASGDFGLWVKPEA